MSHTEIFKKILPNFIYKKLKKYFFYIIFIYTFIKIRNFFSKNKRFSFKWKNRHPQLYDKTTETGFDRHYIYHPAWAARIIKKINPKKHVDISSILNFSSILSAFIPVEFYDYRPADLKLSNLKTDAANLLNLSFPDNSIESISCMHTIEHIGLGRYGDDIDPDADLKSIKELKRVTKSGGSILFVTPAGKPMICFNAHRIYSYNQIIEYFSDCSLKEFSLIPEKAGSIKYNASKEDADKESYGCGLFWFIKI